MGYSETFYNPEDAVAGPSGCNDSNSPPPTAHQKNWKYDTAYFNFLSDFRAENKQKNWLSKDVARKAGEAWRRLSSEQKKPYEEAATRNRKKGKRSRHAKGRRGCKSKIAKGKRAARRSGKRRDKSDCETDDDGTSVSEYEPPTKRRKKIQAKGKGKGKGKEGCDPGDDLYNSDESCICGMKHHPKTSETKKGGGRKQPVKKSRDSDTASGYSSQTDD